MSLFLLRHGQTLLNARQAFYGRLDSPLTEQGKEDARIIGKRLDGLVFDRVITSSSLRTIETGKVILGDKWASSQISSLAQLCERDFGTWEGLNAKEIEQRDPIIWNHFIQSPLAACPKGAEPFEDFRQRIRQAWRQVNLASHSSQNILLISHLGTIRCLCQDFLGDERDFFEIDCGPRQILVFGQEDGKWVKLFS